jgi:hypothetical protein
MGVPAVVLDLETPERFPVALELSGREPMVALVLASAQLTPKVAAVEVPLELQHLNH